MEFSTEKRNKSLISVLELTRLLFDIKDRRPDICIRYRLLGEMWLNDFVRVLSVKDNTAMFQDEKGGKLVTIQDLSNIMQIEIDHSFMGYQPYYHYEVKPMADF
jgi:hypothetical protein